MYLLDTNIFLEYLLEQSKSLACGKFLEKLNIENMAYMSSFSLHAIEAMGGRLKNKKTLSEFILFIKDHPFLKVYTTTIDEEYEVSLIAPRLKLDFDDSMQYFVAKKMNLSIVTLDRDFNKVKDISVLNIDDALKELEII